MAEPPLIVRLAQARFGPLLLALALALVSTPLAALTIIGVATNAHGNPQPIGVDLALKMALLAVLAGALAGGSVGGIVVRRRPVQGLALAVAVAWPVAIATLPVVPNLLGTHLYAAKGCVDTCFPLIDSASPASALWGYVLATAGGTVYSLIPALLLVWGGRRAARQGRQQAAAGLWLGAVLAINWGSMFLGAQAGAGLLVGAVLWVVPYWLAVTQAQT